MTEFGRIIRNNDDLIIITDKSEYILDKPRCNFLQLSHSELLNVRDTDDTSEIIALLNAIKESHVIVYGKPETLNKLSFKNYGKCNGTNNNGHYIRVYKI